MEEVIPQQPAFDTVTEAIDWLKEMGYVHDFNLAEDALQYGDDSRRLLPEEFQIDHVFRFEGMSNPDDEAVVYGVSSLDRVVKGNLVSAFGIYADGISEAMLAKLRIY